MTTYSSRFTPVLAADGGFAPLQLTIGEGTVLLSDICNIPDFCNSAWIQVPGPNSLGFRIDGDDTGVDFMTLPPLAFLPLTNRNELLALVLSAANGDTAIMIQFFHGSVGPMPPAPEVDNNGGVNPPPPPGSAADWTINVVHVMKNAAGNGGNDATGTRNRLDLPFLTPAAAEAVAQAGDEIWIWPGDYTLSAALGKAGVKYRRFDANLSTGGAGPSVFVANGIAFDVVGNGTITGGNAANPAISVLGGGVVNVEGGSIAAAGTALRVQTAGELRVNAAVNAASTAAHCSAGTLIVNGEVESTGASGAVCDNAAALMVINGNVIGLTRGAQCTAGNQTITGDASGETIGADCTGGMQEVGGNALSGAGVGANCAGSGQQTIRGNAGSTDGNAAACSGGIQEVMGSALSENDNGAVCTGGHQIIRGNAEITDPAGGGNAAFCGNGRQDIYGDVNSVGTGPAVNINVATGRQTIHGNVNHTGTGFAVSNIGGIQEIMGQINGTTDSALHVDGDDAVTNTHGDITTASGPACQVLNGCKVTLRGVITGEELLPAVLMAGDATTRLVLLSSAYLVTYQDSTPAVNVDDGGDGCTVQSNYASGSKRLAATLVLTTNSFYNESIDPA